MSLNIINDKIKDLAPGQILSYYGFFKIQEEASYCFFKNDLNLCLFVFSDKSNDIRILETLEFRELDKTGLFYFLAEKLDTESLLVTIKNIISIEDFDTFKFTDSIDKSVLIDSFFRLEPSTEFSGTELEKVTYLRDGKNVLLFENSNGSPVDLVTFYEHNEEVFSEFGNYLGVKYIDKNSDKLLLSFHPDVIGHSSTPDNYNIAITKFNYSFFDIIQLLKQGVSSIKIPILGPYSVLYKLSLVTNIYNLFNTKLRYDLRISPNTQFIELDFILEGNTDDKLALMNVVASFQNKLFLMFSDMQVAESSEIFNIFEFKIEISSLTKKQHAGRIIFRNNFTLISIISDYFLSEINSNAEIGIRIEE